MGNAERSTGKNIVLKHGLSTICKSEELNEDILSSSTCMEPLARTSAAATASRLCTVTRIIATVHARAADRLGHTQFGDILSASVLESLHGWE